MKGKYNFTGKHWGTIFICFILFMITNAVTSDSENVILPLLSNDNGWDYYGKVLTLVTAAGCVSMTGNLILGKVCEKMGAKFVIVLGLLAASAFIFIYGTARSYALLFIGLIGTIVFGQGIAYLGANAVIVNWFPHKKGLAMGFVSVGPPAATVVMVSVLTFIIDRIGVRGGIYTICLTLIVMAVVCQAFIHNTPEEVGCTPDNLSREEIAEIEGEDDDCGIGESTLTTLQVLKTKEFWFIAIVIGICSITQTGLMAQWIVRYSGSVFESRAGIMMSICAIAGIFGSMAAGCLVNALGSKKAYFLLAVCFMAALLMNFTNIPVLVGISVPLFGLAITLFQIFMPAFEVAAFGKNNFRQVNTMMFPIISICGQLTFLVIAACKNMFGEVRYAYVVFAILLLISLVFASGIPSDK